MVELNFGGKEDGENGVWVSPTDCFGPSEGLKRRNMKRLVVFAMAVVLTGCPSNTAYHSAVVAEHDFATGVQAFQQAEIKEFQAGRIDGATHQKLERGVEQVGIAAQVLVTSLQNTASNTTVKQNFDTVATALSSLVTDGVAGIKDPTTVTLLTTLIKAAQDILSNVASILSVPAPTPIPVPVATKTVTGGN
jgi:hypothetical protein